MTYFEADIEACADQGTRCNQMEADDHWDQVTKGQVVQFVSALF